MSTKLDKIPFFPTRHRVCMALQILWERLKGVDFTTPDRMEDRHRHDGAMYYATPPKTIQALLRQARGQAIIDIGCGKGMVLWQASKRTPAFSKVSGVEYDQRLVDICRRNMEKLGLAAEVTCSDAAAFQGYWDYDVFYFFNPFTEDIFTKVVNAIVAQNPGKEITLVYYRPRYPHAIERHPFLKKDREVILKWDQNHYTALIYRGTVPESGI